MKLRDSRLDRISRENGLALLEVIVAMAILTIGIVAVLKTFSSSLQTCRAAETYSTAAMLAGQAASELERRTDLEPGKLSGTFADGPAGYTWEAEVQPPDTNGLWRASISVIWEAGRRHRAMRLITYLRPGAGANPSATAAAPPGGGTGR